MEPIVAAFPKKADPKKDRLFFQLPRRVHAL